MDATGRRKELGRFLQERRARIVPSDVGILARGRRRVAGLRREEVAELAGVGVSWYTMLENGTAIGVSLTTLRAVGRALQLDADELMFLERLSEERAVEAPQELMSDVTRGALAAIEWAPAYVITSQWIVLGWNRAMSLVWGIEDPGGAPFNIVRRTFLDKSFRAMHGDRFAVFAQNLVSMVRSAMSSHLEDRLYGQMCEELQADVIFAEAWAGYNVVTPTALFSTVVHSAALGAFAYRAITLDIPGDDGHWLVIQVPDDDATMRLRKKLKTFL